MELREVAERMAAVLGHEFGIEPDEPAVSVGEMDVEATDVMASFLVHAPDGHMYSVFVAGPLN